MIFNESVLSTIAVVNIFVLLFSIFNLFRKKYIVNALLSCAVLSMAIIEIAKFTLFFHVSLGERILGLGLCMSVLFWLLVSTAFLPPKAHSLSKSIFSPLFVIISLLFFLVWWIKPYVIVGSEYKSLWLARLARYFFIVMICGFSFTLANLERSVRSFGLRRIRMLFVSTFLMIAPYVFLATHTVLFGVISKAILLNSSLSVFVGGVIFLVVSLGDFSLEAVKEETIVHSSLALLLIGGYLFFVGAFIKLFQVFGWNLSTLFSFLTTLFILIVLMFMLFSPRIKERAKEFILKHLTREKYDWQKIWENFTYRISLITDLEEIKKAIQESLVGILNARHVKIFVFGETFPFETEFGKWLLRQGESFSVRNLFDNGFREKFPQAYKFFKEHKLDIIAPLLGERKIIGLISLALEDNSYLDRELLRVLCLQASSVIVNCWAYQKLHESEKKESIYRLSSFIIHDVKNHINSLSLLVSNKDKFHKPEFQKDALETIENTLAKLRRLVKEFKTLRGDLELRKCNYRIAQLFDSCIEELGEARFKKVSFTISIPQEMIVNIDPYYMAKVVCNLLDNSLEALEGKQGYIKVFAHADSHYARILVADNGCGMSKEFLETRLFQPFSTTKKKGLGIGVYQCKIIIEAHGGKIVARSKEHECTEFEIIIPRE